MMAMKPSKQSAFSHLPPKNSLVDETRSLGKSRTYQPEVGEILQEEEAVVEGVEDHWGGGRGRVAMGWFFLIGLLMIGLGGWAITKVFHAQPQVEAITLDNRTSIEMKKKEKEEVLQTMKSAEVCIEGYLKASSILEMLDYVRLPERVKPMMLDYYKSHPRPSLSLKKIYGMRPITIHQKPFAYVELDVWVHQEGVAAPETKSYQLLIEQVGKFSFRVDWEGDVFYMPMPWNDYCRQRPLKPLDLRVIVEPDDFYAYAFRDKGQYQCYKLTSQRSGEHLFGYVKRGTALADEMKALWVDGNESEEDPEKQNGLKGQREPSKAEGITAEDALMSEKDLQSLYDLQKSLKEDELNQDERQPMILRLRFLRNDASRRGVLIEGLVCKHWIYQAKEEASVILK